MLYIVVFRVLQEPQWKLVYNVSQWESYEGQQQLKGREYLSLRLSEEEERNDCCWARKSATFIKTVERNIVKRNTLQMHIPSQE